MPKRQKAKIPSAKSTIDKTPSPAKVANIVAQLERQNANKTRKRNGITTPWEDSKAKRTRNRIAQGVRAKWYKANRANASSIGEKPTVSNTLI